MGGKGHERGHMCRFLAIIYYKCHFDGDLIVKSGKKAIPREQPNQNKKMKIPDPVWLSLFMRDNENCNISHAS